MNELADQLPLRLNGVAGNGVEVVDEIAHELPLRLNWIAWYVGMSKVADRFSMSKN